VLGRAHPHHPHLAQVIADTVLAAGVTGARAAVAVAPRLEQPQPLLDALDQFIDTADLDTLYAVQDALPRFSLLLGPTTVKATAGMVELLRTAGHGDRDAHLPDLAMSVNNLAVDLAEVGRRAEGLTAAQEAVTLYRELARSEHDMYGPRVERAEALTASLAENEA
jgi:hypothetical protein